MKPILPIALFISIGIFSPSDGEPMKYFIDNPADLARENTHYRKEIFTTNLSQLVLMSIPPGTDIPKEVHDVDQILTFVEGSGKAQVQDQTLPFEAGHTLIIPAGTSHRIVNTGSQDLKLYTLYTPPEHPEGTIQKTQADEEHSH